MVTHCREKLGDVIVVEAVAHPAPVALGDHESQLSQHAELLGDGTWVHLNHLRKLVDATRLLEQGIEQANPALGREHAHRLRHLRRLSGSERPVGRAVFEWVRHAPLDQTISEQVSGSQLVCPL